MKFLSNPATRVQAFSCFLSQTEPEILFWNVKKISSHQILYEQIFEQIKKSYIWDV